MELLIILYNKIIVLHINSEGIIIFIKMLYLKEYMYKSILINSTKKSK